MEPQWVTSVIEIYFKIRPVPETQALYRKMGLTTYEYWRMELDWLLNSVWDSKNPEFRDMPGSYYLLHKYGDGGRIELDDEDRKALWDKFIIELGMYPPIFPLKFTPRQRQPPPSSSASPE